MRTVKLISLKISNFKGIKEFSLTFDDKLTDIYGDNATGKTTLFDAVTYLLFNKDSLNSAQFEILPMGQSGVEAVVEVAISVDEVDGLVTTFKKVYSEKWTKKRGSAQAEKTGHNIDHFVNGVPCQKKEYDAAIKEICDEETFRLLTIPRYFNEVLHWTKRREKLFEVCGGVTDDLVISSNSELQALPEILGNHSLDDYKKILTARRTEINKQIESIPVRISEADRSKASVTQDEATLRKEVAALSAKKLNLDSELLRMEQGGQVADLRRQCAELDSKIIRLRNQDQIAYNKLCSEVNTRNRERQSQVATLQHEKQIYESQQKLLGQQIESTRKQLEKTRQDWSSLNSQVYVAGDPTCPSCGQLLPEDKIKESIENFNQFKATRLEEITEEGKRLASVVDNLVKQLNPTYPLQAELDELLSTPDETVPAMTPNHEIAKLENQKQAINTDIEKLQSGDDIAEKKSQLSETISGINTQISELNETIAQLETNKRADSRIKELKGQEKTLAKEFEKIESELALIELFIRTKANMVTEQINSRFKLVKFNLFEEQINGGIKEVCNSTVNDVPYESLNNGARINAGLDIINVFSEHHGIQLFQFIDNAEAVTALHPTESQRIRLIVSETDKTLFIGESQ